MSADPSLAKGTLVYGDTSRSLGGVSHARSSVVTGEEQKPGGVTVVGDAGALAGLAQGGADTVSAHGTFAEAVGDALKIGDLARGGDDVVSAYGDAYAWAYGDAEQMRSFAVGGADNITVNAFGSVEAYGDAGQMSDFTRGGNDTLVGETSQHGTSTLYGDAGTMSGSARGGNDVLSATFSPTLYGDARTLSDHAQGGADTLTGASVSLYGIGSALYGDGETLSGFARGGDDVLISGVGPDRMWGDAAVVGRFAQTGADRFVFAPDRGQDEIMDFQHGKDHIELDGFGYTSFRDLAGHLQTTSDGVLITFDAADSVLVHGVRQLTATDFLFG